MGKCKRVGGLSCPAYRKNTIWLSLSSGASPTVAGRRNRQTFRRRLTFRENERTRWCMKLSPLPQRKLAMQILLIVSVSMSALSQTPIVNLANPGSGAGHCPAGGSQSSLSKAAVWNGWGVDLHNSRFQPPAQAGLDESDIPRLRLKWAFGFDGATVAFSQPAVAGGRLFVGSEAGEVFALDPESGCIEWSFHAQASVRTGFVVGSGSGKHGGAVYFGDQHGAVYTLDVATGQLQ